MIHMNGKSFEYIDMCVDTSDVPVWVAPFKVIWRRFEGETFPRQAKCHQTVTGRKKSAKVITVELRVSSSILWCIEVCVWCRKITNREAWRSPVHVLESVIVKYIKFKDRQRVRLDNDYIERAERQDIIDVLLPIVAAQQIPIYEQNPYQHGVLNKHGQFEFSSQSLFTCAICFGKPVVDSWRLS